NDSDSGIGVSDTPSMALDNCVFDFPNLDAWQLNMDSPFSDDTNEFNQLSALIDDKNPILIGDGLTDHSTIDQFLAEFEFAQKQESLQQIPCLSPLTSPSCYIQSQTIKSPTIVTSPSPASAVQYHRPVLPKPSPIQNLTSNTNYHQQQQQQQHLQPITNCVKLQSYTNTATSGKKCVKIEPIQSQSSSVTQMSPNITIITTAKPITVAKFPLIKMPVNGSQVTFVKSEPDSNNSALSRVAAIADTETYYSTANVITPPAKRRRSQSSVQQHPPGVALPVTTSITNTNCITTAPAIDTIQSSSLTATTVTLDQLKVQYGNASLMENLEVKVKELADDNDRLKNENNKLLNRIQTLEMENDLLKACKFISSPIRNRKPVILMGIVLLVNVIDHFRSLSPVSNDIPNTLAIYDRSQQYARSLPLVPSRAILSYNENDNESYMSDQNIKYPYMQCVAFINKTHSQRINKDLHSWVEDHNKQGIIKEKSSSPIILNSVPLAIHDTKNKKTSTATAEKPNGNSPSSRLILRKKSHSKPIDDVEVEDEQDHQATAERSNSLQPYNRHDRNHDEFFRAINRKNDTVYIVSFKRDHLILPATVQNQTQRPKMTLVMPASMTNFNKSMRVPPHHVPMIQIDCEVDDTKLVYVKRGSIPFSYQNDLFQYYTTAPQKTFG
ncbi:unnamed protein product, partial [Didymodactylos carnosus]